MQMSFSKQIRHKIRSCLMNIVIGSISSGKGSAEINKNKYGAFQPQSIIYMTKVQLFE
jgi:hypothetical protein